MIELIKASRKNKLSTSVVKISRKKCAPEEGKDYLVEGFR